jgi:hypothetical protein
VSSSRRTARSSRAAYREWLDGGYFRDWPPQQIIEIRRLNPFKPDEPYSMSDAGKDSQFTLKQAARVIRGYRAIIDRVALGRGFEVLLDTDLQAQDAAT